MRSHITAVAWIHLILGGLQLVGALAALLVLFGAGLIGGAAAASTGDAEAILGMGLVGTCLVGIGVAVTLASLPGALAGWGLLSGKKWAPILAVIVSLFYLPNFPFGTALAVYTFWVCFSREGQDELGFKVA